MKGRLPNRLRVIRAERGITQVDLALKAGLSPARYWKIENAVPPEANADERSALARALRTGQQHIWPELKSAVKAAS